MFSTKLWPLCLVIQNILLLKSTYFWQIVSDGNWSEWIPGTCDNCGTPTNCSGNRTLTRTCNSPSPCGTGAPCPGSDTKVESCSCPVGKEKFHFKYYKWEIFIFKKLLTTVCISNFLFKLQIEIKQRDNGQTGQSGIVKIVDHQQTAVEA